MNEKINKYQKDAPMTFCLVATIDPRLKLSGIQISLEEINNNLENTELDTF